MFCLSSRVASDANTLRSMLTLFVGCCACALVFVVGLHPTFADSEPRRIFLLESLAMQPATVIVGDAFRRRLHDRNAQNVEVFLDFLELGRIPGRGQAESTARYLGEKYARTSAAALVTLGRGALVFALEHRDVIGAGIPIIFCSVGAPTLEGITVPRDVVGIVSDFDWGKTLQLATRLQPEARDVVIISGASTYDKVWERDALRTLAPHLDRYKTTHLAGLDYAEMLERVSRLPRDTIILSVPLFADGSGQRRAPPEVTADIARVSSAPVYSALQTTLGHGIVGGYMDDFETQGAAAADLAIQIVAGNDVSTLPARTRPPHSYQVDARKLRDWHLSENELPPDTVIRFKEPTLWENHRTFVLAVVGAIVLQSAALIALLVQIRRRKLTELALRHSEQRLMTIQEEEHQRIADELHDSTVQHLTAMDLNLINLRSAARAGGDINTIVEDIGESLQEAIKELRAFSYLLHPTQLETDGLTASLKRYIEGFARRTRLRARLKTTGPVDAIPLQLQQALLRIVQEALANVHRHASASRALVNLSCAGRRVHLVISDDGKGSWTDQPCSDAMPAKLGVGIPGMRARRRHFGGRLDVRARPSGTIVHAVVSV
jgi:signal transduction histidine kinase